MNSALGFIEMIFFFIIAGAFVMIVWYGLDEWITNQLKTIRKKNGLRKWLFG